MLINILFSILPPTRMFTFKRFVLRYLGVEVGAETRVCGGLKVFGAGRIKIGKCCWIGLGCTFYTSPGSVTVIGDACDIAPETCFMNGSHDIGPQSRRAGVGTYGDVVVGDGSWVGVRTTLLGGVTVEPGCIIAARSLLLPGTYKSNYLYAGSPAVQKKELPI